MNKQHKIKQSRKTGVPIQICEGVLDLLSKLLKPLNYVFCENKESMKACVAQNSGRAHKYQVKVGQGYFCKCVTWVLNRLETKSGLARFAVDQWHRMCVDRCQTLDVDLRTGSMVSYGLLLILSPKCTKITTFLQSTLEPVNMLKRLQNRIITS